MTPSATQPPPAGRRPPPDAPLAERVGWSVRASMEHPPTREMMKRIIFQFGRALAHGKHDVHEAGRRDYARDVLALLRRYAPEATAAMTAEWIAEVPEPAKVRTADDGSGVGDGG